MGKISDILHVCGRGASQPIHSFDALFLCIKNMDFSVTIRGGEGDRPYFYYFVTRFHTQNKIHSNYIKVILDVLLGLVFPHLSLEVFTLG